MTAVVPKGDHEVAPARPAPTGSGRKGSLAWKMLTTTDHKMLGLMYIIMAFCFFFLGGFMALLIRAELFSPGLQYLSNEQFNQLFTMHGTVMLLLYGTPVVWGFANYVMPLQIGAPDVAFPRLNAFGFWLTAVGCCRASSPLVVPPTSAGPCTRRSRTPSTPQALALTCGFSAWVSVVSVPSSPPST